MENIEQNLNEVGIETNRFFPYNTLVIIISIYFLGSSIFAFIQLLWIPKSMTNEWEVYTQGLSQIFFLLTPTILIALKSRQPINDTLRISKKVDSQILLLSVLGVFFLQFIVVGITVLQENLLPTSILSYYKELEKSMEVIYKRLFSGEGTFALIRALVIGAVIPAISEEILFRAYFQKSLERKTTATKAIIITSLIFAFIHFNPISFLSLVFIGAYLGYIAYITDSIYIPIIIHFINNALAVSIFFSPSLTDAENNYTSMPLIYSILMVVIGSTILIAIGYYMYKILKEKSERSIQL